MQEEKEEQGRIDRAKKGTVEGALPKQAAHTVAVHTAKPKKSPAAKHHDNPYLRPENEDDDGYDPFSDRPPEREPLFQRDPWA